ADRARCGALADLTAAERQHDRAHGPPGPFTSYPRAALEYQRGLILQRLGDPTASLEAFETSLALRTDDSTRPRALSHARYAELLLDIGYLEAACVQWTEFLVHLPALRSHRADLALTRLIRRLRPHARHGRGKVVLMMAMAQRSRLRST
ncbi:hypothetical protein P8605_26455, partial [Streptomyces sp. T-3]|nr:hypothetical protein [Streptomyces sp. T-3]